MDVLGIEIKTDALVVAHIKSSLLSVEFRGCRTLSGDTIEARLAALKGYISENGIIKPRISLILPRGSTVSKVIDVPSENSSAISEILRFEIEKHVPFKPEETCWGFDVITKKENVFSVLFFATRTSTLDDVVGAFSAAGLKPYCIGVWQVSVGNALFHWKYSRQDGPLAVVGMDAQEVTLDIFSDFISVYSSTISFGRLKGVDRDKALKTELGYFLRSGGRSSQESGIGGCALMCAHPPEEHVLSELADTLGLSVTPLCLQGVVDMPSMAVTALGATLMAVGKGRVKGNFALSSPHKKAKSGYWLTMVLSLTIVALLTLTGATYMVKDRITLNRLTLAMTEMKKMKESRQALVYSFSVTSGRIKALEEIKGGNSIGVLDVLKELTNTLPKDTWLTEFEYKKGRILIGGLSETASTQLLKLERSGFVKDAEFVGPVTKVRDGKEAFRIRFRVVDYGTAREAGKVEE